MHIGFWWQGERTSINDMFVYDEFCWTYASPVSPQKLFQQREVPAVALSRLCLSERCLVSSCSLAKFQTFSGFQCHWFKTISKGQPFIGAPQFWPTSYWRHIAFHASPAEVSDWIHPGHSLCAFGELESIGVRNFEGRHQYVFWPKKLNISSIETSNLPKHIQMLSDISDPEHFRNYAKWSAL